MFIWKDNLSSKEWDTILSALQGHPLQSAKWGDSRKKSNNIDDLRWIAYKDGQPVFMARLEIRKVFGLMAVAWIPKGPAITDPSLEPFLQKEFLLRLKQKGFFVCANSSWKKLDTEHTSRFLQRTIWVDLKQGKDKLWGTLSKQVKYDIRRAKKYGVIVERSKFKEDIDLFYKLCEVTSQKKQFELNTSYTFLVHLLQEENSSIEAHLFIARREGKLCGGAVILRCGDCIHYMWGAIDRACSKYGIGEAIQAEVIEWAISQNCKKYDLEGIDPKKNPGTYQFKKKWGGEIVVFPEIQIQILNKFIRKLASWLNINYLLKHFYA
jgi:lipid II:glycine glycyltransferase (peptidoglycan interpeptide bridge formation enzyme)